MGIIISSPKILFLELYPTFMPLLTVLVAFGIAAFSRGRVTRLLLIAVPLVPVTTFLLAPYVETGRDGSLLMALWPSGLLGIGGWGTPTSYYIWQYAASLVALIVVAYLVRFVLPSPLRARLTLPETTGSALSSTKDLETGKNLIGSAESAAFLIASLLAVPALRALLPAAETRVIHGYARDWQSFEGVMAAAGLFRLVLFSCIALFVFVILRHRFRVWLQFLSSFSGRASRRDYWLRYWIPTTLVVVAAIAIDFSSGIFTDPSLAKYLGSVHLKALVLDCWFLSAVLVKRCHDINRSGLFALPCVIPAVGVIWLLVLVSLLPGTSGPNRFGGQGNPSDA